MAESIETLDVMEPMPREPERVPLRFPLELHSVSPEEAEVMSEIKQTCSFKSWTCRKPHFTCPGISEENLYFHTPADTHLVILNVKLAEKLLYHWKTFPIVLPQSLTNQGDEKGLIHYRDLFKAPSFDELEVVATDAFGELKKLDDNQLKDVWNYGEFQVASVNFPGQVHRWRLSQLLQKGTKKAHNSLLDNEKNLVISGPDCLVTDPDSALALRLLIITARNRIVSPFFSLSESVKSWGRGLWKLMDIVFGMPSTSPGELESKIQMEHMRYLVAELDVKPSYRQAFAKFCSFVKEKSRLSTAERNKNPMLRPPPIPYIYQTPKGMDIDLRLFNGDLINNCIPILSNILERESKGWYVTFRQKMIQDLKGQGLATKDITKAVNEAVKEEYLRRVFKAILNNAELESVESGIASLLVAQAKSVIAMQKAINNLHQKMEKHKADLLSHLKSAYPVKSRISGWISTQTRAFEREFVKQNYWSAHEEAISLCEEDNLFQAIYFLRRDLNFIKEREEILLKELGHVRIPNRIFTFSMRIWFPSNWVTVKTVEGEETIVPTVIGKKKLQHGPNTSQGVFYHVNKYKSRKTSTRYPLWRWYNYIQRTWTWMWNSVFLFGVVIPWCSPLSIRALIYTRKFMPDLAISQADGVLYPDESSTTQTLISRLTAIWVSVRKSRKTFETTPDRGFIGKSFTRHLNRFWNYVIKGVLGSFLLLLVFPAMCVTVSTLSLVLAVSAPVWTPVVTLLAHMFAILVYDIDCPDDSSNRFLILCEALIWRFLIGGLIQPITASLFGFVVCPLGALAISIFGITRRGFRSLWDTFMYYAIVKPRSRIPANDSFLARRIAGPGLASNYFLQIHPEQALAALEATMEAEELETWKAKTLKTIEQPVENYKKFILKVFKPFSAGIVEDGVYKQLLAETSNYKTDLTNRVSQRQWRLNTGLNFDLKNKVKLTEKQLKVTILHASKMMEDFYPSHVIGQLSVSEEEFWERRSLEYRDWTGLASQKLSSIFSSAFLVPLEDTDNHFKLEVRHLNLGRYITMLESADVHDDLDLVTEVHTPTDDVTTKAPHLDTSYFNPTQVIMQTRHYQTFRKKKFPWSTPLLEAAFDKLQIPLPIPHPAVIAVSIYNREHESYTLNFDDLFCHTLIKAVKSFPYTHLAEPEVVDNHDIEMSTPDNGIEPVSVISHLAEQEQSISDDSSGAAGQDSTATTGLPQITPYFERRIQKFADEENLGHANINISNLRHDADSVTTENEIGDDIYVEDEMDNSCVVTVTAETSQGETSL